METQLRVQQETSEQLRGIRKQARDADV